jgi:hypothetical protein
MERWGGAWSQTGLVLLGGKTTFADRNHAQIRCRAEPGVTESNGTIGSVYAATNLRALWGPRQRQRHDLCESSVAGTGSGHSCDRRLPPKRRQRDGSAPTARLARQTPRRGSTRELAASPCPRRRGKTPRRPSRRATRGTRGSRLEAGTRRGCQLASARDASRRAKCRSSRL